jgi:glycolate oxidase FAD binding subunit
MSDQPDWLNRFRDLIGPDAVDTGAGARAFTVDGLTPRCVVSPATAEELSRCVAAAHAAGLAVIPAGNGTQLGIGRVPRQYDVAVSTRRLRLIVAHEAADMTATVQAGLTLAELNAALAPAALAPAALAPAAQRLPLDPPCPERATIGGVIATDACGPLRLSQGKVRDLLIGITVVLADGTLVHGGGRVVKNVAGYDLMKLFAGSFGTLGIVVEATFKIRPCPAHEVVCIIPAATTGEAVHVALDVLAAPLAPLYVEALDRAAAVAAGIDRPATVVGCGGSAEEVAVQRARIEQQFGATGVQVRDGAAGAELGVALRDFPARGCGEDAYGCKVSVLPSQLGEVLRAADEEAERRGLEAAVLAHAGSGVAVIRCPSGAAADGEFVAFAESLRATVRAAGGWVVFDALPLRLKERIDPWGADTPAPALMRGVKQTLDPHGRLSPGRFVGGI